MNLSQTDLKEQCLVKRVTVALTRNIARELHDDFGQHLTALNACGKLLEQMLKDNGPAKAVAGDVRRHVEGMYDSLAAVLHWMRVDSVNEKQFKEYVQKLIDVYQMKSRGVKLKMAVKADFKTTDPATATVLYRTVQELLTNCAKHSDASQVYVSLDDTGGCIRLSVRDNGRAAKEKLISGYGLQGIQERAELLGGSVLVEDADGWSVTVMVPAQ